MEKQIETKWNSASLRISSINISSVEITKSLHIEPTKTFEKGTLLSPRNPKSSSRKEWLWLYKSGLESSIPLEEHITQIMNLMTPRKEALEILSKDCFIELFCGFSSESGQGGITLDRDILKKLSELPLEFSLDLYPPLKR